MSALPEQEFAGVVREVALQPGDYRGDVADAPLRWEMTALVEIETD